MRPAGARQPCRIPFGPHSASTGYGGDSISAVVRRSSQAERALSQGDRTRRPFRLVRIDADERCAAAAELLRRCRTVGIAVPAPTSTTAICRARSGAATAKLDLLGRRAPGSSAIAKLSTLGRARRCTSGNAAARPARSVAGSSANGISSGAGTWRAARLTHAECAATQHATIHPRQNPASESPRHDLKIQNSPVSFVRPFAENRETRRGTVVR